MLSRRRIVLQLTPLLDLLLIVIFAQYLEVRQSVAHQQLSARQSQQATEDALRRLQSDRDRLQVELQNQDRDLKFSQEANRRLTELAERYLTVPKAEMDRAMKAPAEGIENFRTETGDEVTETQQQRLLQFLRTYVELRKRTDVWELYLEENGTFTLLVTESEHPFRAVDAEEFAQRLFDLYRANPQPRNSLVILFSYGDARADDRQIALKGLELATERIRQNQGERARVEFSVLGFQAHKPLLPVP
ncbi:MAG: hypothetical protein ACKVT0_22230 [Planctomycetaceae bacterium]